MPENTTHTSDGVCNIDSSYSLTNLKNFFSVIFGLYQYHHGTKYNSKLKFFYPVETILASLPANLADRARLYFSLNFGISPKLNQFLSTRLPLPDSLDTGPTVLSPLDSDFTHMQDIQTRLAREFVDSDDNASHVSFDTRSFDSNFVSSESSCSPNELRS